MNVPLLPVRKRVKKERVNERKEGGSKRLVEITFQ